MIWSVQSSSPKAEGPTAADDFVRVVHGDGTVDVVARLERRKAEAFALTLRALARRYGLEVESVRVVPDEMPPDDRSKPDQASAE